MSAPDGPAARSGPGDRGTLLRDVLILAAVAAPALFLGLGARDLWSSGEARIAEIGREMWQTGQWVIPHFNGEVWPTKPPLLYWLIGGLVGLLGDAEWVVRLPSAAAGMAGLFAVWLAARDMAGPRAGLIAALVCLSSPRWLWAARTNRMDMLMTALMAWALVLLWRHGRGRGGRAQVWVAWVLLAAAVLAKGHAPLILTLLVLGAHRLWMRAHGGPPAGAPGLRAHLGPVVLFLLLALPWFVVFAVQADPDTARSFFFGQTERWTFGKEDRPDPWWYYLPQLFGGSLPWSLLLVPAGWWAITRLRTDRRDPIVFALLWVLVPLVVFSLPATKAGRYSLPAVPAVAILIGVFLERAARSSPAWSRRASAWFLPIAVGTAVMLPFFLWETNFEAGPTAVVLEFCRNWGIDLNDNDRHMSRSIAWCFKQTPGFYTSLFVSAAIISWAAWLLMRMGKVRSACMWLALMAMSIEIGFVMTVVPGLNHLRTAEPLVRTAMERSDGARLAYAGDDWRHDLRWYADRHWVRMMLNDEDAVRDMLAEEPTLLLVWDKDVRRNPWLRRLTLPVGPPVDMRRKTGVLVTGRAAPLAGAEPWPPEDTGDDGGDDAR